MKRGTGVPSLLLSTCSPLRSRVESNSFCVALKKKSRYILPLLFFRCWRTPDKSWLRPTCIPLTRSRWTTRSKKVWLIFLLCCSKSPFLQLLGTLSSLARCTSHPLFLLLSSSFLWFSDIRFVSSCHFSLSSLQLIHMWWRTQRFLATLRCVSRASSTTTLTGTLNGAACCAGGSTSVTRQGSSPEGPTSMSSPW